MLTNLNADTLHHHQAPVIPPAKSLGNSFKFIGVYVLVVCDKGFGSLHVCSYLQQNPLLVTAS